jgi:VWFA-related protein
MQFSCSAPNLRRAQFLLGVASLFAFAAPAALAQSASASAPPILQLQAPLVLEDIVVLDSHDQPVHNLKTADFTITDDGKPVTPQSFEEHAALTPAELAAQQASMPKIPNLGVNVFTNYTPTPPGSALNILVLDTLNTPVNDQAKVRQKMLKFLVNLPPGTPLAIFGLGSHLYLLQGFTSDPALLKAAVAARVTRGTPTNLQQSVTTNGESLEKEAADANTTLAENENSGGAHAAALVSQFLSDNELFRTAQREEDTIAAVDQLARYLAVLPGRKNLIWCSGAFPLDIIMAGNADAETHNNFSDQIRKMEGLLARGQVAVYPIDAGGLITNSTDQAMMVDNPTPTSIRGGASTNTRFLQQTTNAQAPMDQVAEATGGKAFYNTDDLTAAVQSAVSLGSNYYTISYTPPAGKWDGKYHRIDVKLNQRGLHLSYRRGYFSDNPAEGGHGEKQFQSSAMQQAMLHGAPQPTELLFDLRAVPADETTAQLTPGSTPDPKLMQPPYRSYTLDTLIDIHFVQMTHAGNGEYQGSLDSTVLVYSADGDVVNTRTRQAHFVLPPDRYADLLAHGLSASQSIEVPVKGTYFIRIGLHDPASNRVGAVEIPVATLQSKQAMIAASAGTTTKQ